MAQNYPKFIGSSVNPEQLALTIKGLLVGLIPAILLIAKLKGIELAAGDLQAGVDAIVNVIIAGGAFVSAVLTVWGLLRKAYYFFKNLLNK